MTLINDKEKLERVDRLIRLKATGSPDDLAIKLNTTKRTIQRTIQELKKIGCPIYYDRIYNSYCYEYIGKLIIKFETLEDSELSKIKGGLKKTFSMPNSVIEENYICTEELQNSFLGFSNT